VFGIAAKNEEIKKSDVTTAANSPLSNEDIYYIYNTFFTLLSAYSYSHYSHTMVQIDKVGRCI